MSNKALQELLSIADELAVTFITHNPYGEHSCKFCGCIVSYEADRNVYHHDETCPFLKLEKFKSTLSL